MLDSLTKPTRIQRSGARGLFCRRGRHFDNFNSSWNGNNYSGASKVSSSIGIYSNIKSIETFKIATACSPKNGSSGDYLNITYRSNYSIILKKPSFSAIKFYH